MECSNCSKEEESDSFEFTDQSRLKWNWFYVIVASCLVSIGNSSPLGTLHEFLTNPTLQQSIELQADQQGDLQLESLEPGLGATERLYALSESVNSVGGVVGGLLAVVLASTVPYWHSFLFALLLDATGFLLYATAQYGWTLITARVLVGVSSGLQRSLAYAYIGVSYQDYVEVQLRVGKRGDNEKYCRVKDIMFSLYTIATSGGYFLGSGFSALLAQFPTADHFRAVGWYNFALAVLTIVIQLVIFRGESSFHFTNLRQIKHQFQSRRGQKCINAGTCSTILILAFLLLCTGVIRSRTTVYEILFEPVLSDSFGFTKGAVIYYFLCILLVPVFGGVILFLMEWSRVSNLLISILGIIASIMGLAVMSDWQAIPHDPCLNYSLPQYSEAIESPSALYSKLQPSLCWNLTRSGGKMEDLSDVEGHVALFFNFFLDRNSTAFHCKLHSSTNLCYACPNITATSRLEMNFEATDSELCYSPSSYQQFEEHMRFSVLCEDSNSDRCVSACLNVHHSSKASQKADRLEKSVKKLFHQSYDQSVFLMDSFLYEAARNKCESMIQDGCHWIPDSVVTHMQCAECEPICRGKSRSLLFAQFLAGAVWFMLTYPVAEMALPVVLSDSVHKEFQGIVMGLTVAMTEMFQLITPLWLIVAYESAGKRTFLPLMILIATFLPFLFGLMILYRKLIQLRETKQELSLDTGEEIYDLVNCPDRSDHEQ